jgi:hypothetical protein
MLVLGVTLKAAFPAVHVRVSGLAFGLVGLEFDVRFVVVAQWARAAPEQFGCHLKPLLPCPVRHGQ